MLFVNLLMLINPASPISILLQNRINQISYTANEMPRVICKEFLALGNNIYTRLRHILPSRPICEIEINCSKLEIM